MECREMERADAMKAYLQGLQDDFILDLFLEERLRTIWTEFAKAVESPVRKLAGQKTEGVVVISYLRSSIVTGSHEFYIAYYSGEPFVEEEPECVYLDLRHLFEGAEADCGEIIRILGKKFVRLLDSEKEELRRWYLYLLYERLGTFMEPQAQRIYAVGGIPVLYGGYMEELY